MESVRRSPQNASVRSTVFKECIGETVEIREGETVVADLVPFFTASITSSNRSFMPFAWNECTSASRQYKGA